MSHLGQAIWVQPLVAGGERLGFLALAGEQLDDWDRQAAQQGAAALALELAKEQAVIAAEDRLRGDFVQMVLAGPPADSEALMRRGQELGYDLRKPHVALLCSIGKPDEPAAVRAAGALSNALGALGISAPTMRRADGMLCYLPLLDPAKRARAPEVNRHGDNHYGKGGNAGLDLNVMKKEAFSGLVDDPDTSQQEQAGFDEGGEIFYLAVSILMIGVGGLVGNTN